MWNAGDPPPHNTLIHMVFVPAKETPFDTQTHPTPETDAIYRTTTAGFLVSLAGVIDAGMLDQDRGDEGVVSRAIRAEEIFQLWRYHVERFDQATGGPLLVFSSRITTQRYLIVTTRRRAQISRDRMPKIVGGVVVSPMAGLKHSRNA